MSNINISEKIVFQGKAHLGKQNGCIIFIFLLIVAVLLLAFFEVGFFEGFLESAISKVLLIVFIAIFVLFPKKTLRLLFRANKTGPPLDLKIVEVERTGFFISLELNQELLLKFEYPFEYKYFRSLATKTDMGNLFVMHLLIFKDDRVFRFSNYTKSSDESPYGWETTNVNLPPSKYVETDQIVDLVKTLDRMSKNYEHLRTVNESEAVTAIETAIKIFQFQHDPSKDTEALLKTKEGKQLVYILKIIDIPKKDICVNANFFDNLKLSEKNFYWILSSLELEYGIDFPDHTIEHIKTVGYLIQYVKYLKEVYD